MSVVVNDHIKNFLCSMRCGRPFAFIATLLMIGCVPVKESFYIPSDEAYRYGGRSCGDVPYGGYHRILGEGVEVYIRIVPNALGLGISMEFSINAGASLYFVENKIGVRDRDGRSFDASLNETGKGLSRAIDLTKEMKGIPGAWYTAVARVSDFSDKKLYLVLPDYVVSHSKMHIDPIEFYAVERKGFVACIQ